MTKQCGNRGGVRIGQRLSVFAALFLLAALPARAQAALRIGVILDNPPYVIEEPSGGIDNDIIRRAFLQAGREVDFMHVPLSRLDALLADQKVDAVTTFAPAREDCTLSDPFSYWHDGVIVRRDLAGKVKSLADLKGLKVGTFPNAELALGPDFAAALKTFERRVVVFRTELVLPLLERDRIDAYVGDFWAVDAAYDAQFGIKARIKPYMVVAQFPPTARRLCFADPALAALFNRGLKVLRQTGTYEAIVELYHPGK